MKFVSWNINSLRKRQQRLLDWLAKEEPDVVCLQETKCSDDQFPELALAAAGYRCVFHGQKSYNGVAILSRHELRERQAALCDESEDPQARVIAATIKDVRVFSIYAPNGQAVGSPAFNYKLQWFVQLRDCIAEAQRSFTHVIVCGDFNVAPDDRDVYDSRLWRGAIMCSEEERAAFRALEQTVCAIPFASIMSKAVFLVGGIIGCWRFKKIADSGSMRFLPANHWPNFAPRRGSIAKCAKAATVRSCPRLGRVLLGTTDNSFFRVGRGVLTAVIPSGEDDEGLTPSG